MIIRWYRLITSCGKSRSTSPARATKLEGFSLIELLVVLFILMLLAAVALPNVRRVLLDQKASRASRSLLSFIDVARSRAIAEGREIGVRFERLTDDDFGRSVSLRCRQLTGVPPYCGESSDATMILSNALGDLVPGGFFRGVDTATFVGDDHQLLLVSAQMIAEGTPDLAPIRANRDRIELPGGKVVRISSIFFPDLRDRSSVKIRFDLREISNATPRYPQGNRPGMAEVDGDNVPTRYLLEAQRVKYKIHRSPNPSSSIVLSFPRGIVIDLNYSGLGQRENDFISTTGDVPLDIVFGPDGSVSSVRLANDIAVDPTGQLFLCLGDTNGVRPDNLLANDGRDRGNLFREKSLWVVINQYTGRAFSSPIASISTPIPMLTGAETPAQLNALLAQALQETRLLASLSDNAEGI